METVEEKETAPELELPEKKRRKGKESKEVNSKLIWYYSLFKYLYFPQPIN